MRRLSGKRVAILATDGFEQSELFTPMEALRDEGAMVEIVAPHEGTIQGVEHMDKGKAVAVDTLLDNVIPANYDAIVLPGGAHNPDALRIDERATSFVRSFFEDKKPVAAICHAPWVLINAGVARGRTLTSWPTIRQDLRNAGAEVVDEAVVVDNLLVTSRGPKDLPAFCEKMIAVIAKPRFEASTS